MINRYNKETVIKPGQYVNMDTVFTDGLCGRPRLVIKISGKRIYLENPDYPEDGEKYKALDGVRYVCDSLEESQFLYECSEHQIKACNRFASHVKEAIQERIKAYESGGMY